MCMICVEWEKGRMTNQEAFKAMKEYLHAKITPEQESHFMDLTDKILEKEIPQQERDLDTEQKWWDETHTGEE